MMKKHTPDISSEAALLAWFAEAGLLVEAVDRCPAPGCERCRREIAKAA